MRRGSSNFRPRHTLPALREGSRNLNYRRHRRRGGDPQLGTRIPPQADPVQNRALRNRHVRHLLLRLQHRLLGGPPLQRQVPHSQGARIKGNHPVKCKDKKIDLKFQTFFSKWRSRKSNIRKESKLPGKFSSCCNLKTKKIIVCEMKMFKKKLGPKKL